MQIVNLLETTPVHEAAELQDDLKRASIAPFAWVIKESLSPLKITDPVLRSRQKREGAFIREVVDRHAMRTFLIPWQSDSPDGADGLRAMIAGLEATV